MKYIANTTRRLKIVAIDDSQMILNFLKAFFGKEYDVTTYGSTSEALKDLSEGKVFPDCILSDFYLGNDMTGLEFISQYKELDSTTPILILSGSCEMNQKLECLQSGAADFVTKPFNPMELDVRVKNALSISSHENTYRHAV
ncbi:response regulator [Ekhidna sp.]